MPSTPTTTADNTKEEPQHAGHAQSNHDHNATTAEEEDYEIDHSTLIYLLDRDGNLTHTFPDETAPSAIVNAINEAR